MTAAPKIRVGLIGANASRGWGTVAHIPALRGLGEFDLVAVATSQQSTADESAATFGVPLAFGNATDLAEHPDVDVVAVTVRVTEHDRLVRAALAAGKHVLCEWPLGLNADEARGLHTLADAVDVRTIVGLQGQFSPGALTVRDTIDSGGIGRLTSVNVIGAGGPGGARTPQAIAYTLQEWVGANVLGVYGAHWLATLDAAVGRASSVTATIVTSRHESIIDETDEVVPATSPDQLALSGIVDGGALLSLAIHSGVAPADALFEARFVGTDATLIITPAGPGSFHMAEWTIRRIARDGTDELIPARDADQLPPSIPTGPPRNVASVYRELGRAISEGRPARADFGTALRFHELVSAIDRAAKTGSTQLTV